MSRALVPVLLALAAGTLHGQQTRFAAVRVSDAFQAFTRAKQALEEIENRRKALAEDPRLAEVDEMAKQIRKLQETAGSNHDPQARDKAIRDIEIQRDQLESTGRMIEEDRVKAERELNRELVERTQQALETIRQAAAEVGRERGFDVVIDSTGHSNTGVPVILYSGQLVDLTSDVIARVNQPESAKPGDEKGTPPPAGRDTKPAPPAPAKAVPGKAG